MKKTLKIEVFGRVQMVGFRWFSQREARRLNIKGNVKNTNRDTVLIIATGESDKLDLFNSQIKKGPISANVTNIIKEEIQEEKVYSTFDIIG
ncbi:MAG: acylphosphatase [Candidatus Marinimicrobia bacterium]|nr:acylphosphatase [Candidatus Neomarinimicrobiota bacterium]